MLFGTAPLALRFDSKRPEVMSFLFLTNHSKHSSSLFCLWFGDFFLFFSPPLSYSLFTLFGTPQSSSSIATMKRKQASVFDAVALLDQQDAKAIKSQRRVSERERQRSLAAQSQTEIYGRLVETRILLQRSLHHHQAAAASSSSNNNNKSTSDTAVDRPELDTSTSSPIAQCNDLLARLLRARQSLFPIRHQQEKQLNEDNDDNNSSESDEDDDNKSNYEELLQSSNSDDEKQLSSTLQSEYNYYQDEWKEVLDRRNKDVRLHSGATHKTQFRVMDASFWQQVENTVQHEELRQKQEQKQQQPKSGSTPAIFDDTKVYQQLLKDFVSVKGSGTASSSSADALQQRKQTKAANKKKAQVDRRASKGRKIRYTEIQKLTNFTFPVGRPVNGAGGAGNDLDEDVWFKSLFGGAARLKLST